MGTITRANKSEQKTSVFMGKTLINFYKISLFSYLVIIWYCENLLSEIICTVKPNNRHVFTCIFQRGRHNLAVVVCIKIDFIVYTFLNHTILSPNLTHNKIIYVIWFETLTIHNKTIYSHTHKSNWIQLHIWWMHFVWMEKLYRF